MAPTGPPGLPRSAGSRDDTYQKPSETKPSDLTLAGWTDAWLVAQKKRMKVPATLRDSEARLRTHVLPTLGERLVADLRADDLRELFAGLRVKISAATGRPISQTTAARVSEDLRKLLARAEVHLHKLGVHFLSPYRDLEDGDAPTPAANPRDFYRRHEVELLISDPRVPGDRRVFWTLLFCTGMRHDEAAGLRWRDIDWSARPLPLLTLREQAGGRHLKEDKKRRGVRRVMPVHPALRDTLTAWRADGWKRLHGRAPASDDYICPRPTDARQYRAKRSTLKQIRRDAEAVGVTPRTTHETRNTFPDARYRGQSRTGERHRLDDAREEGPWRGRRVHPDALPRAVPSGAGLSTDLRRGAACIPIGDCASCSGKAGDTSGDTASTEKENPRDYGGFPARRTGLEPVCFGGV